MSQVTELASKLFHPKSEYRPKVLAVEKRIRGVLGGKIIFDTTSAVLVWEHQWFPQYWIPKSDFTSSATFTDDAPISGIQPSTAKLTTGGTSIDALLVPESFNSPLAGFVKLDFEAVDQWFAEMSEILYHPKDPYHRVDIHPSGRHVKITTLDDGTVLADTGSDGGVMSLWETGFPGRWYLPRTAVNWAVLAPSETSTGCPYKGAAKYYSYVPEKKGDADGEVKDVAWWYPQPLAESAGIVGMLCFYPDKVQTWIDGKKLEKSTAQVKGADKPWEKPKEEKHDHGHKDYTNGKECNC